MFFSTRLYVQSSNLLAYIGLFFKYSLSQNGQISSLDLRLMKWLLGAFNARIKCTSFLMQKVLSSMLLCQRIAEGNHFFVLEQVLHSRSLLLMMIEEVQILTSFLLHCKENLRHRVLNEVLNTITHVVSNYDSICLSSKTSDVDFIRYKILDT